jgi:hypothetical protein
LNNPHVALCIFRRKASRLSRLAYAVRDIY